MRYHPYSAAGFAMVVAGLSAAQAATVDLPANAAGPVGSGSEPGFLVRVVQAPEDADIPNNYVRAIRQLNGSLTDASGTPVPDEAQPGPNPDGGWTTATLNFERDAGFFDVVDVTGEYLWSFYGDLFPGIPGNGGHTTKFALEAVAFLELPAGETTFGVSVATDRTDMNDDDSYQVFVSPIPRDFFAPKVAQFERNAPPFASETHNENQWTVVAPQAGVYPFRIIYWQGGRGANLQFYTVLSDSGERILVNNLDDPRAIKAYTRSSVAATGAPYVGEVMPLPGSAGNDPSVEIHGLIFDGAIAINDSSVRLTVDGVEADIETSREGNRLSFSFAPDPARTDAITNVRLEFADASGAVHTREWEFQIDASGGSTAPVTGQWDFNAGNLAATVGADLEYLGGPEGLTAQGTQFGTTTSFGIDDINGEPALVMRVPGDLSREIGYIMTHGISPNGGGTLVNQFTLIMDVYVAETGSGAASLLQISSPNNSDDGDLFWQGNNFGQGADGYNGRGTFTAGAWHRVAAAYDMAANPPVVVKYVDGIKQDEWTANQGLDNPRRALQPTAILFADGDQDERREMFVNSIQIRAGRLSDAQLALLGKPTADGIPLTLPETTVTGQWDFDFNDLGATIGRPLTYLDGPEGVTQALTRFGVTGEDEFADIPHINGEPAGIMYVPGDLDRNIGYVMEHLIPPNGGGTLVNQYTIIFDVMVGDTGAGAAAMLQISSPSNTDDGDLFWQGNNFGQGADGYIGTGIFTPREWHRVVAAYDMAATPPRVTKYVDGEFQHDWVANQSLDNPRRALQPTAVLFADGDQDERREWWVNAIQIRAGALSKVEIEALGGPSASGIPIAISGAPQPDAPTLTATPTETGLTLSWAAEAADFILESSPTLPGATWTPVAGVVNNSVTVTPTESAQFYRLRRP